ncbi:MAG: hypothetical protein ACFFDN_20465, partial [Candidatus Hodarchaeota archaeon]
DDHVDDPVHYHPLGVYNQWVIFNSSFFNLTNICFACAASMNISSGATPIAITSDNSTPQNAIVGAKWEDENGRVICVTDYQLIWNGYIYENTTGIEMGIIYGNNSNFVLKIFEWLAHKSLPSQQIQVLPEYSLFTADTFLLNLTTNGNYNITTEIIGGSITPNQTTGGPLTNWTITVDGDGYVRFTVNNSNESKTCMVHFFKPKYPNPSPKILFSEVNFSRRVDQSITGLYNFAKYLREHNFSVFASKMELPVSEFDAVCLSNPLQNISSSQISNLLTSKRLLVLGESYTDLLQVNNTIRNPINVFLLNYGINLTHHLICDNISNYRNNIKYPTIQGIIPKLEFFAYQSSVFTTIEPSLKVFASGKSTSWGENHSYAGDWTTSKPFDPYIHDSGDITPTPFIVFNSSIMAIGDTDIVTNERGDAFLFPFLECWLKTGNPYVNIDLNHSKERILLDGKSEFTITSGIILDSNGNEVNDGTLITISTNLGTIVSPDEDRTTPGTQISVKNKILRFIFKSGSVPDIANISVYNFSLAVIGQVQIKFKYYPIPELITIFIKNQIDLEQTNNFILTLTIISISIGAVSSILIIERKKIQSKIISFKTTIKQKNIEKRERKQREKFVRKKL